MRIVRHITNTPSVKGASGQLTLRFEDVFLRFLGFVGGGGPDEADGELIAV